MSFFTLLRGTILLIFHLIREKFFISKLQVGCSSDMLFDKNISHHDPSLYRKQNSHKIVPFRKTDLPSTRTLWEKFFDLSTIFIDSQLPGSTYFKEGMVYHFKNQRTNPKPLFDDASIVLEQCNTIIFTTIAFSSIAL